MLTWWAGQLGTCTYPTPPYWAALYPNPMSNSIWPNFPSSSHTTHDHTSWAQNISNNMNVNCKHILILCRAVACTRAGFTVLMLMTRGFGLPMLLFWTTSVFMGMFLYMCMVVCMFVCLGIVTVTHVHMLVVILFIMVWFGTSRNPRMRITGR